MAFLCTACTFLVMVILVIGVTLINNYDRMTQMEHAIYELSENLSLIHISVPGTDNTSPEAVFLWGLLLPIPLLSLRF